MGNPVKVGITHGDVNGVSYEIILKALADDTVTELFTPVIFGVPQIAKKAIEDFELNDLKINVIEEASQAEDGKINLVALKTIPELHPGEVRKDAGESSVEALEVAVEALKNEDIDVLVTAPISKEAVQSENFKFPGHTEFLSQNFGDEALMILFNDYLKVALQTVHIPVTKIAENITEEKIEEKARKLNESLIRDFGVIRPKIAILSLNPHAGDGGVLGMEEENIISPAINNLVSEGILAFGPFAADGFFGHGMYKKFDGILAMYHDQGLAPFKTIASTGGVNFTAGLSIVRTSPDHGTAYDIAWKGVADSSSMRDAIYAALDIFRRRKIYTDSTKNPLQKYVQERPEK